jgi:hypothetical protein
VEALTFMKRHIPFALKSTLCIYFAGFLLAGCCSTHCVDCIPLSKMPYAIYDGGVKYLLIDHLSINEKIRENNLLYNSPGFSGLKKKFPNNRELLAYLDQMDKVHKKIYGEIDDEFWGIKSDLEKSGGEFYDYRILGKKDEEVEEGWLILSRGKVFKKYVTATAITGKDY